MSEMGSWSASTKTDATPDQVIRVLTDPEAIGAWSPVPFDVSELDGPVLRSGSEVRVSGSLAGMRVGFDVEVHEASSHGLRLTATGPIAIDVSYELSGDPEAIEVDATVAVRAKGITGRVLGKATEALLAAGALEGATGRIARAAAAAPVAA
ncbi:hypothetical protein HJD18_10300 [Thermoleophilia bacterium SCSIO 60948]|nr:hypothetical protein HJD18_10300 [Thermoleophilia bacterium SCSIO 60948]